MSEDQRPPVPESFLRTLSDEAGGSGGRTARLSAPQREALRQRHELCEDLASHLRTQARELMHETGLDEDEVLRRIQRGLAQRGSGLSAPEALWITQRLAELLHR